MNPIWSLCNRKPNTTPTIEEGLVSHHGNDIVHVYNSKTHEFNLHLFTSAYTALISSEEFSATSLRPPAERAKSFLQAAANSYTYYSIYRDSYLALFKIGAGSNQRSFLEKVLANCNHSHNKAFGSHQSDLHYYMISSLSLTPTSLNRLDFNRLSLHLGSSQDGQKHVLVQKISIQLELHNY